MAPARVKVFFLVPSLVQGGAERQVLELISRLPDQFEMVLSASSPDELRHTTNNLSHRITGMSSFDFAPTETAADGTATVTCRLFRKGYPRPESGDVAQCRSVEGSGLGRLERKLLRARMPSDR